MIFFRLRATAMPVHGIGHIYSESNSFFGCINFKWSKKTNVTFDENL